MARRRSGGDRFKWAAGAGAGTWAALGGRFGAGVGLLVATAVAFPGLIHGAKPGRTGTDTRPAVAGIAAAAGLVALLGIGHLTFVLVLGVLVALAVWLWPWWKRHAARSGRSAVPARSSFKGGGRARVRGNHHGRVAVVEEVPTGRVGIARKRGGDGPTQVELCARAGSATALLERTANRRYVHSRWKVSRPPGADRCPLDDKKQHWVLRSAGPASRTTKR